MAYIKREKYTIIDDNDLKKELLEVMKQRGVPSAKARQLVYYPVPMSLIRWARYLDPEDMDVYLELYVEDSENQDDFGF